MVPESGETRIYGILIAETSFRYRHFREETPTCSGIGVVPEKGRLLTTCRLPMPADFLTALERQRYQTLPADLLLGVNHGDWCLNGISQRQ